jgi:hypothetical protein
VAIAKVIENSSSDSAETQKTLQIPDASHSPASELAKPQSINRLNSMRYVRLMGYLNGFMTRTLLYNCPSFRSSLYRMVAPKASADARIAPSQ